MNNAALKGLSLLWHSNVTIVQTAAGFEVRNGGRLVGTTLTMAGALELARLPL